jgi:dipeptidyl aminopeptidase/acylaminoacyl peptidase
MKIGNKVGLFVGGAAALCALAGVAGCNSGKKSASSEPVVSQPGSLSYSGSSAAPRTNSPTATTTTATTTPTPTTTPMVAANPAPASTETPTLASSAATEPTAYANGPALDESAAEAGPDLPTTTNISRVTFAEEGADFDPCVSKDGTHVVFASTQHRKNSDIYIKRTDSRVVTQLTNDPADNAMPSISPDGTKVAFASNRSGNWDIYVMPITGGKAVQITSDASDEIHPSWSPDGKQLVFCRMGTTGRWEMWTTDVQNPSVENFIGYGLFPQWCPVAATGEGGSDRILFQLGKERGRRAFGLWTVDVGPAGASNSTEIASSGPTALINPTWSPDGKWIVYAEVPVSPATQASAAANSESRKSPWSRLWMVGVEGEGKVRLTSGPGVALSPTWSGNRLFFVCDRTGAENIWSLDVSSALAAAQATVGGPAVAKTNGAAPVGQTPKTDSVANVTEGDPQSNAAPR